MAVQKHPNADISNLSALSTGMRSHPTATGWYRRPCQRAPVNPIYRTLSPGFSVHYWLIVEPVTIISSERYLVSAVVSALHYPRPVAADGSQTKSARFIRRIASSAASPSIQSQCAVVGRIRLPNHHYSKVLSRNMVRNSTASYWW